MTVRAIIFTEAGANIGFGHLMRTLGIYDALRARGVEVQYSIKGDASVPMFRPGLTIEDWAGDPDVRAARLGADGGFDLAIIDSYLAGIDVYRSIRESVADAAYLDDFNRLLYPPGVVINGSMNPGNIVHPADRSHEYLLGARYIPLRQEFTARPEKTIRDDIERVLVTVGGSDTKKVSVKLVSFLTRRYPHLEKVIIGAQYPHAPDLERLKDDMTRIVGETDGEGMRALMDEADIALSACGQTLHELAACGVPTIGVCVSKNQEPNAQGWAATGFLQYAGWHDAGALEENISGLLAVMQPPEAREQLSRLGQTVIDGRGAVRIAERLTARAALTPRGRAENVRG